MSLKKTIHSFPLKVCQESFILAVTPPHAEWFDHPVIYLEYDRVKKAVWRDPDPTYYNLRLTNKMCAWVTKQSLFSHFVFMFARPLPVELPLALGLNIKHLAYRPMDLERVSSHVLNVVAIRRQLGNHSTVHIVIPQRLKRISLNITTDARALKYIALLFLMRYRIAVVGQAEQDGHWDVEAERAVDPVKACAEGGRRVPTSQYVLPSSPSARAKCTH
ncbi:hypothetical protein BDV26DRAFT_209266 [Aspergillus bertholletiae]|uniref:Uncharacterized protein n=1 Tax=Aspergillus bertholletiae TaxID=1226010 RepID=A0A5N7BLX1_9EURO|nr:hypothetical protein BDV26DRAFT_209266 [Aspergillus bertholletiae]